MAIAVQAAASVIDDPTAAPFNGIVLIQDVIGGETFQGSGVLITPTEVLTASHVVYETGQGAATQLIVTASSGSGLPGRDIHATTVRYNQINDANGMISLNDTQSDFAIIHLAEPIYSGTDFQILPDWLAGQATVGGYPASAGGDQLSQTGPAAFYPGGLHVLLGPGLGPGSSGGPLWVTGPQGQPQVVGIVSSSDPNAPGTSNDVQLTTADLNEIKGWIATDGGNLTPVTVADTSTGQDFAPQIEDYTGPVAGLQGQYINISSDNLNFTAGAPNLFLHSGSGFDAIQALSGINVLDGGTGSNFLVGGTGTDTFFTDDRGATADIWDTLAHFHAGDAATLFGVTQSDFSLNWVNGEGAAGYQGLTLHATSPGAAEASVTLAGYTTAALTNGQLAISFGTTQGVPYLYIHGNL